MLLLALPTGLLMLLTLYFVDKQIKPAIVPYCVSFISYFLEYFLTQSPAFYLIEQGKISKYTGNPGRGFSCICWKEASCNPYSIAGPNSGYKGRSEHLEW
jgi:hypothetical protein